MKRALLVAVLVGLAAAAPANADKPHHFLRLHTSISPPVQLFARDLTARVTAIADTKRVDPSSLRASVDFSPYEQVGQREKVQTGSGRYVQTTWTWKLRCLTAQCIPVAPPSDVFRDFHFAPAQVRGISVSGKWVIKAHGFFPPVKVFSEISPGEQAFIKAHKHIEWQYQLAPAAGDTDRLSPGLLFWLALALAALCAAAGIFFAVRWALRLRTPVATGPAVPVSYLEQALALFFWANEHGDETLQRKALERVADELPLDVVDLSDVARELAWSPETPEGDEVEAISERAGVPVHPEDRNGA